jgi:HD-GYP domain-containing protein (c-di-GMP phosphodiesterase class II)
LEKLYQYHRETYEHSLRVANTAYQFGKFINYHDYLLNDLYLIGAVHDVGKLKIPLSILNKKGALTQEEYSIIKQHPQFGFDILTKESISPYITKSVLYHHENWDGTGYYGLKSSEIPFFARIIRIIDSYDTMYYGRLYQQSLKRQEVLDELERCAGRFYDPNLTSLFINFIQLNGNS